MRPLHARSGADFTSYSASAPLPQTPTVPRVEGIGQRPFSKLSHSQSTATAEPAVSVALAELSATLWRAFVRAEAVDSPAKDERVVQP